jgi:hypothetical protein
MQLLLYSKKRIHSWRRVYQAMLVGHINYDCSLQECVTCNSSVCTAIANRSGVMKLHTLQHQAVHDKAEVFQGQRLWLTSSQPLCGTERIILVWQRETGRHRQSDLPHVTSIHVWMLKLTERLFTLLENVNTEKGARYINLFAILQQHSCLSIWKRLCLLLLEFS